MSTLPTGPTPPPIAPPAGAWEQVAHRVQRARRRRTALASGLAVVVLAASGGTALALSGGSSDDALRPAGPSTGPTTGPSTDPTAPAATSVPSPAATGGPTAAPPPAVTSLEQGGRYFGVYLAVVRDQDGGPTPADEAKLAAAKTEAARLGYDVQRGLSCDDGAVAGLGLDPSRNYDSVQVYFATAADAQQFVDLYQPGVVGTAQVQTFCLD